METQECLEAIEVAYSKANKFGDLSQRTDMHTERLPFTVKLVSSEEDLAKAVSIRHRAYDRHVPVVAQMLTQAELYDFDKGAVVLLAESKLDGSPIGTMRIQTNSYEGLALEHTVKLPEWLRYESLAEATRLGVAEGRAGRLVKTALFKAYFQYCEIAEIEWMVITARAPLDRQYDALMFRDVYGVKEYIPMHHVCNIPHRVMAFEVSTAKTRWTAANHPLLDFMCGTHHPDIDISGGDISFRKESVVSGEPTFATA